ncbi:hypothetical protein EDC01DRAFT_609325, partial [Geopyxis carbonaria]
SPQHPALAQHRLEVIEITDSDTDSVASTRNKKKTNPPSSTGLQPPFDTTSRAAGSSSNTKPGHRASASPSIASLINPDNPPRQLKSTNPSPTATYFSDNVTDETHENKIEKKTTDTIGRSPKSKPGTFSSAPSPKPSRPAAPVGSGNGLLSNVLPGGNLNNEPDIKPPNIYIHVPLNGEQNKYVNFAKLAEDRYGWAALNPKLAKAKLALQMDSGDEMMLDGSESESNADNGTAIGDNSKPKKRQKRSYQDVYDKMDPFIDDSEMLWEEQAAASKDGFFVYSGPLVPEGEKPQIERADGTVKRGRGRGRGSRGGATSNRGTGATARKPRITKKEKEKLEKEKEERERFSITHSGKPLNSR